MSTSSRRIYRLDTFTVPGDAITEFVRRIRETHELLRKQPGFVQDFILEQPAEDGAIRIVTLAEWEDEASIKAAREVVQAMRKTSGFDPGAFMKQAGIEADFREYYASDR